MFVDQTLARRIEQAEAAMTRDGATALMTAGRAPRAFVRDLGSGVAACVRPGSALNKVIGIGLDGAVDERALAAVEAGFRELGEPVRAEVSTLAAPEAWEQLAARRYRLAGFENVLVRTAAGPRPAAPAAIELTVDAPVALFAATIGEAFCSPDGTGAVLDQLTRAAIAEATEDLAVMPGVRRYLARREGAPAGAANLRLDGGVAILAGSATLPAHRRRGVQSALLARRLQDARDAGADLVVVTTAPGTQSQANMMKAGFALAYARAVLVAPLA